MERVSDEILEGIINDQGNIIAGSWNAIHYLLIELQVRRKAEKEQWDMEHMEEREREKDINEFWKKIAINYLHRPCSECPATDVDDCGHWDGTCGHSLRKKYESIAGPHPEKNAKEMILPAPVTQVDGVDASEWTVKDLFQKINEELDELKDAVIVCSDGIDSKASSLYFLNGLIVAEEAADTITAITSMLEAMGIDENMRQEAQRRVNERNAERKRL